MLFFSIICGCCCGRRWRSSAEDEGDVNESSRLIPEEHAPTPGPATFDYGRFEERLDTIVRAQEGRMVNVHHSHKLFEETDDEEEDEDEPDEHEDPNTADAEAEDIPALEDTESTPKERSSSRIPSGRSARIVNDDEDTAAQDVPPKPLELSVGSLSRSWGDQL
ncbi:hypothetical protein CYLTODRAFT_444101 [Cylindrobasidium torrendii FP15055 ss-10]|uniref:Uncharacterized protein n=1 Tax=Cylindrobasidium torrendii FP15055 ss-10 TaxID=1314674 RepID=A0A0D7B9S2_9AGAR|nr:hypothetical protein CYLTODRAFT_444101 [Cylindrobasidium torrendii FP15055 ss-10]